MKKYDFKLLPEGLRAAGFGVLVFLATLLVNFDLENVLNEWETYVTSLVSGGAAAAAAAFLAAVTRNRPSA